MCNPKKAESSSRSKTIDGVRSIKILGSGCKACHKLYDNTVKAVEGTGIEVEYVTDLQKIMEYQDCRDEWGNVEPDDELYPEVRDMNKMYELVSLNGVIVYDEAHYGKRIISLFYDCTWDEEEGMGIRIALGSNVSEVKVVKIGNIGYAY